MARFPILGAERLRPLRRACFAGLALIIAGCESLPHDGPSARQVAETAAAGTDYALVELDYRVSQIVASNPPQALRQLAGFGSEAPIDLIGEGDVLSIAIFQAGAGPFANSEDEPDGPQTIPRLTVDRSGAVTVPFAGPVRVAGLTPSQAATAVQAALRGRAINPQVTLAVTESVTNTVTVVGEVRSPGRIRLQPASNRLLDIIAAAGGPSRPAADTVVTVSRGAASASNSLATLLADPAENVRLAPQDQVRLAHKPRKFSTFGAFARASQLAIEDDELTLAAAISRMGGLDPNAAAASSVFLFRFERPEVAQALGVNAQAAPSGTPLIYTLNLREPSGYFVANSFEVRADDLIYAPRADAAELRKFFELVTSISRVAYDISVTNVLR